MSARASLLIFAFSCAASAFAQDRPPPFALYPGPDGAPAPYRKEAPAFRDDGEPWKHPYGRPVTLKVDAAATVAPVTPWHFGNNVAWWNSKDWFLHPDRLEKARQSGIRFWRFPGGSSSDEYVWDGNYGSFDTVGKEGGGRRSHMNADWAVDTDDFIEFCRQTGSQAIVTVNYGISRVEGVERAADLAARWVEYFNKKKKFKVWYWEIGNENYGPWEFGTEIEGKSRLRGSDYGRDFRVIAEAMRRVDPDIYIGAVAVDTDSGDDWNGYRWWMRDLLPHVADAADYLVLHQYFLWPFDGQGNYTNPPNETLFDNLRKLGEARAAADAMVAKYTDRTSPLPVALTEYNLVNASPRPTLELVNGLFTAEVLGESIRTGYVATNFWDWKNGLDAKLGGDHAVLSSGDPDVPEATPRPSYYAFPLYDRAFGHVMVRAESPDPTLHVYASRFSGGEVGLVVVNEREQPRTAVVEVSGFSPSGRLNGWVLSGKGLNGKHATWNGRKGPSGGGGPFPIDSIPPYRARFDPAKPLALPVPPHSACGIVLYSASSSP